MSVLTLPCDNCGCAIPADVYDEELGFCVSCSYEYWGHAETGVCGHFVAPCPEGLDCNSFCPLCEGTGDVCRVCSAGGVA
jgi:hypothetical protein